MKEKIAIIGGGIVGATAAYYLSRSNFPVTLYDEGTGQATSASAGIIAPWLSLRRNKPWYYLVSNGAEFYHRFMHDLETDGFNTEDIYEVNGAIFIRKNKKRIQQDLQLAPAKQMETPSIGEVKELKPEEIRNLFPFINSSNSATWVSGGGRVDGAYLIQVLHQAIKDHGGRIIPEKAALHMHSSQVEIASTNHPAEKSDKILLAAGAWLPQLLEPFNYHVDVRPQKGQLLVLQQNEWKKQNWPIVIPPGQVDIIPFNHGEIVIGASHEDDKDYDLSVDEDAINALYQEALQWAPNLANMPIAKTKVGIRAQTSDYSVIVGKVPELSNVWAISGLGSSGLTSGPFLGYQWSHLIQTGHWQIDPLDFPIENYIHKIHT